MQLKCGSCDVKLLQYLQSQFVCIKLDAIMGQSDSLPVKIDADDKNQLLARGYRLHHGRCALATLAIILTFGLLLIPILWRKDFKMFLFYKESPLQHASKVLIKVRLLGLLLASVAKIVLSFLLDFVK